MAKDKGAFLAKTKKKEEAAPAISEDSPFVPSFRLLRGAVSNALKVDEPQSSIQGNEYIETWIYTALVAKDHKLLIVNDLPVANGEVQELVQKGLPKVRDPYNHPRMITLPIDVTPFGDAAAKLVRRAKMMEPDLLILPMRGGQKFHGLLPASMHSKVHTFNISERFDKDVRLDAISALAKRYKQEKPKKIVWLDDVAFQGLQSGNVMKILNHMGEGVEFHRLVLAAEEKNYPVHVAVKTTDHTLPVLASKLIPILANIAREDGHLRKAEKLDRYLGKCLKEHGESGWA